MSQPLVKYWTWEYEIKNLGCWPTRPPYAGHTEPREIYLAADVARRDEEMVKEVEMIEAISLLTSDPLAYLDDIRDRAQRLLARLRG